jgi:hypothetical protein
MPLFTRPVDLAIEPFPLGAGVAPLLMVVLPVCVFTPDKVAVEERISAVLSGQCSNYICTWRDI